MASLTPAEIVGVEDEVGSLAVGKWADIVLIDENVDVKAIYLGGRKITAPPTHAKSDNQATRLKPAPRQ
jgi:N-acetylglucosamine-6-phosphate deacetylase